MLFDLKPQEPLNAAVKWVCSLARDRLAAARSLRGQVPTSAASALLPARIADLYLKRFQQRGYDPLAGPVESGRTGKQVRLLIGTWRGRY